MRKLKNEMLCTIINRVSVKNKKPFINKKSKESIFVMQYLKNLLEPIKTQKELNIETCNFRCIGGCGQKVMSVGGACGWAGGGVPACQH